MATELLYLIDQKILSCPATVISAGQEGERSWVVLDRTIAHVSGGGQPGDRGSIDDAALLDVRVDKSNGSILHLIDRPGPIVGTQVSVDVDSAWRILCSKLHSGGHLLAAAVALIGLPLRATGGHHWPKECRLDFSVVAKLPPDILTPINDAVRRMVAAALPIEVELHGEFRNVVIGSEESGRCRCGGTHAPSTADLELLVAHKAKLHGEGLRLSYSVGDR